MGSREWVKSSAVPSNKELFALEMSLELSPLDSRERRCSPSNSTRRSSSPPDPETLLVCPSRVSPRTRRSTLVTLSTSRRRVNSCPSSFHRHGCRPGAPWCPQGWLLSYHLLPYCQGCLQNDQDLVEAIEEDRKCQGRDASRAHPIRERRS